MRLLAVAGLMLVGTLGSTSASVAAPSAPSAPSARKDSVIGSGTSDFYGPFVIDARSGPGGESPVGLVSTQGEAAFNGPITCLSVTGNVAVVNAQTQAYGQVTLEITDNAASGRADEINAYPTTRPPTDCSHLTFGVPGFVVTGDLVVIDAVRPK